MPWIAEALAESERSYQAAVDASPHPEYSQHPARPYMMRFASHVGSAALFWLSRTAISVAADLAGREIPEVSFRDLIATSDLPPVGLLAWPKSLAAIPWKSEEMRISLTDSMTATWDGLAWVQDDNRIATYLLSRMVEQRAKGEVSDARPKWSPGQVVRFNEHDLDAPIVESSVLKIEDPLKDPRGVEVVPPTVGTLVTSMLALIGQQRVVTKRHISADRPANSMQRSGHRRDITLLDILRPREVTRGAGKDKDDGDRELRRWWVRGHWRQQPYGPNNSLRKLIYVDMHTAGPIAAAEPSEAPTPRVSVLYGSRMQPRDEPNQPNEVPR
jgi:hypothetical protein